jgi:hypothetical protein
MSFNPNNSKDIENLRSAMRLSRQKLEPFRRHRLAMIRQFVGDRYSDTGSHLENPINVLELAITIYSMHLVHSRPRVIVTTQFDELKSFAVEFELVCNVLTKELRIEDVLQEAFRDAFMSIGIVKTGLAEDSEIEINPGFAQQSQAVFADVVGLDNWVHDMRAEKWQDISFAGDRRRVLLEEAKQNKNFNRLARDRLSSSPTSPFNKNADFRSGSISQGHTVDEDEFKEFTEVWDVWIPQDNLVVTLADDDSNIALDVVEWEGREIGPYHHLGFGDVPGNIMPSSPGSQLIPMHEHINRLARKLANQAEREKEIHTYTGGAQESAENIRDAMDGDMIHVTSNDDVLTRRFGGINPQTLGLLNFFDDRYSRQAGNLDLLGGLSAQSETLGQEQILAGSASRRLASMQAKMQAFTEGIIKELAWRWWTEPLRNFHAVKQIPDTDIQIPFTLTPSDRRGDFLDYNFSIDPYSMEYKSPEQRLAKIGNLLQGLLLPAHASGALQQEGIGLSFKKVVELYSNYENLPELKDILISSQEAFDQGAGPTGNEPPKQAPVTKRINERRNVPSGNRSAANNSLQRIMLGQGGQPPSEDAETVQRTV